MTDTPARLTVALADRYTIERELGAGGMATVYLAHDLKHDRKVAVKVLRPELAAVLGAERFVQEIKTTANLQHPHILPLFDSGEADGFLYYVMPYVDGESLRDKLNREKQLTIEEGVEITKAMASALDYAHRHDVIHRDIKPENVMLSDGLPVVADFGIAKALYDAGGDRITQTGLAVGTPAYMSPEQAAAEQNVDARSDVYACGCVLYEMLAGEPPYTGSTAQAVISKMLTDPIPSIKRLRHSVPTYVDRAICKALAKTPADRFASPGEFVAALIHDKKETEPSGTSIAVLPFANVSADRENEYFSDGITEEIINSLVRIPGLRVTARTSAFAFKGENRDVREVGEKLNVEKVLEGSVRRAGRKLRITAQLINVKDGYHLWSERYDRELKDVFDLQDEIATTIASKLEKELGTSEVGRGKRGTENLKAYEALLKGRFYKNKLTRDGLTEALELFKLALELEPHYAEANAEIADSYFWLGFFEHLRPGDAYPSAESAAVRAVKLDGGLAEAHTVLAVVKSTFYWNWVEAEREFTHALELNPHSAMAHWHHSLFLGNIGRFDEAIAALHRALSRDPLWIMARQALGYWYTLAGQYDAAAEHLTAALEINPTFPHAHWTFGLLHLQMDRSDEAVLAYEKAVATSGGSPFEVAGLAYALSVNGRTDDALKTLAKLRTMADRQYVSPVLFVWVNVGLGEFERAFEWLDRAQAERASMLVCVPSFTWFDPLRSDPRFRELVLEMGLPVA